MAVMTFVLQHHRHIMTSICFITIGLCDSGCGEENRLGQPWGKHLAAHTHGEDCTLSAVQHAEQQGLHGGEFVQNNLTSLTPLIIR